MTINIALPNGQTNLRPRITVIGVGGAGGNAVNNMINSNLEGVDFLVTNTDAQALENSLSEKKVQLGLASTEGLGAGMRPDIGKIAAEEASKDIESQLSGSNMAFIAAGMGGGTGTGAAPIIAKIAREKGILTVGVVTKPFHFEGMQRMRLADSGIDELEQYVDTLIVIPNQNLFRIANEKTTFSDAFKMADDVLQNGVRGVTDLMVMPGLINLDFSDVKTVMSEMGKAMMGTGQAQGENRAIDAAEDAIANPLIDDVSLKGAKGLIINITGGKDLTLYEVDEAANRIREEVEVDANIIFGSTCDDRLEGAMKVSIVATGIQASTANVQNSLNRNTSKIHNSVYEKSFSQKKFGAVNSISSLKNEQSEEKLNASINSDNSMAQQEEVRIDNSHLNHESSAVNNNIREQQEEVRIDNSHLNHKSSAVNNNIREQEEGTNMSNDNLKTTELEKDENVINNIIENNENIKEDIIAKDANHNISNNENEEVKIASKIDENFQEKTEPSRLSLFDNIVETKINDENRSVKKEPVLDFSDEQENNHNQNADEEYNQDFENSDLEDSKDENEDFESKEKEDELLDIPTFLRRQAN